jgi:hypothetical protein
MATSPVLAQIPRDTYQSYSDHAYEEARALLRFTQHGESVDAIRSGIKPNRACDASMVRLRYQILLAFDALCTKRGTPEEITPELRAEILRLLALNFSCKQVGRALRVSLSIINCAARPLRALKRGRGRRFTPTVWKLILAAVRSGRTSREVQSQFGIHYVSVLKARKELGDTEDRRRRRKITPERIQRAEQLLRAGESWADVARTIGLSQTTVIAHVKYRKYRDSFPFVRLSRKKHAAIVTALLAGQSRNTICRELRASARTVDKIRHERQRTLAAHG